MKPKTHTQLPLDFSEEPRAVDLPAQERGRRVEKTERRGVGQKRHSSNHGHSRTRIYTCWVNMKSRCYRPSATHYNYYGGRGISVCERWKHSFANFLEDMLPTYSPELTIDRIDNDKDYSPENCRWVTRAEQTRNNSSNIFIELDGRRMIVTEWSRFLGLRITTIRARLRRGWSHRDALSTNKRINKYK